MPPTWLKNVCICYKTNYLNPFFCVNISNISIHWKFKKPVIPISYLKFYRFLDTLNISVIFLNWRNHNISEYFNTHIMINLFEKPYEAVAKCNIPGIGQREYTEKLFSRHLIIDISVQCHTANTVHPFWKNTFFIHCVAS